MQSKKSRRATEIAQKISRFFHRLYVEGYTKIRRIFGKEYCVVTCFPKSEYRVNTPVMGYRRGELSESIKNVNAEQLPDRRKIRPPQDPDWVYKALIEADKIEVPEYYKP
jgi:hypothetical protein